MKRKQQILSNFEKWLKLAEKLTELRQRQCISIREASKLMGISANYLSEIERGLRSPSPELLRKIANMYNVNEWELFQAGERIPLQTIELLESNIEFAVLLARMSELDKDEKMVIISELCELLRSKV